ncbi:MAG: type II secretion system protein GspD [Planctomycetota bacterium]
MEAKAGVLPTDRVQPGGYLKAPIQDALKEIFYDLSYNKGIEQPIGYVVYNTNIVIITNPHDLVQKTYTLNPELRYDESGAILQKDILRLLLYEQLWPLMNPNELWKRDARDVMLDEDILKVIATEQAHILVAKKLSSLEPSDLKEVNNQEDQIAIEARFLLVPDNFLEDIGLDVSISAVDPVGQVIEGPANSKEILAALELKPLGERKLSSKDSYDEFQALDDLQVDFILKATQAHNNAKMLTAPKVMVLNGESASIRVSSEKRYKVSDQEEKDVHTGVMLDVLPVVTEDEKYVILKWQMQLSDILEWQEHQVDGKTFEIPNMQIVNIPTCRTAVKDRETLLITGPEMTASRETVTNPGLGKIPILGRYFSNRSIVTDKQRLLILIKPTVIIQDEVEADAIGALAPISRDRDGGGAGGMGGGGFGGGMRHESLESTEKKD